MATSNSFLVLKGHEYMSLTTFRKSGQAVPTPVWFVEVDGKLYVYTSRTSGKVKRIRNNPAVTVAPCALNGKLLGEAVQATARILSPSEEAAAEQALNRKYGWKKRLLNLTARLQRHGSNRSYLEISPA